MHQGLLVPLVIALTLGGCTAADPQAGDPGSALESDAPDPDGTTKDDEVAPPTSTSNSSAATTSSGSTSTSSSSSSPPSHTPQTPEIPLFVVTYDDPFDERVKAAFDQAVVDWTAMFTELLIPAQIDGETTQQVLVLVTATDNPEQGPNQAVGWYSGGALRDNDHVGKGGVRLGTSFSDTELVAAKNPDTMANLFTHELGHILSGPVHHHIHPEWCTVAGWEGPQALDAYQVAGGTKDAVPTPNPSKCGHWDLPGEIMNPSVGPNAALSSITLGLLKDGGYPVAMERGEPYTTP